MAKTNKALQKRVRITRRGKVLARQSGQNHFNAKSRRSKQLGQKKLMPFTMATKTLRRYLSTG
ncbi:MAG TPA: 50S ribosomal protein L35 [Candidatus Paceibacterota bacterium]